jgi:hypothetical protein
VELLGSEELLRDPDLGSFEGMDGVAIQEGMSLEYQLDFPIELIDVH